MYIIVYCEQNLQLQICGFYRVNHLPVGQKSIARGLMLQIGQGVHFLEVPQRRDGLYIIVPSGIS